MDVLYQCFIQDENLKNRFSLNKSLLEVIGDCNGFREDPVDSAIGLGDGGVGLVKVVAPAAGCVGVDFGNDGVGLVKVVGLAADSFRVDFGDVGVEFFTVQVDVDVIRLYFGNLGFNIITT